MNKFKFELFEDNEYVIDGNRFFACDKKILNNEYLKKIKYPLMLFDTEFINRSHNKLPNSPLYLRKNISQDLVYIVQYAIFNSEEELKASNNDRIHKIVLERNVMNFSLYQGYDELKEEFVDICMDNNIKMFACSGGASDFRLIKGWFFDFLTDEEFRTAPFINYHDDDNWDINQIDVYDILKSAFSFENSGVDGGEYIEPSRLKKGAQNKAMLQFPSFNKLFNWTEGIWDFSFRDEQGWSIYDLCVKMFEFYNYISGYRFNIKALKEYQEILNITIDHCWNDVYKILIFLEFCREIAK